MTKPYPVYIIDRMPGAEGRTVAWTDISRERHKVFISYEEYRDTSRWKFVERARKFRVYVDSHASPMSSHASLAAAEKAAADYAKLFAESDARRNGKTK